MSISESVLSMDDVILVNTQFCKQLGEPYGLDDKEQLEKTIKLTVTTDYQMVKKRQY